MRLLHYLKIENFKQFADAPRIELDHPSVLIGPNNCGKTSAIQAIALWSQAVKAWHQAKAGSSPKKRPATPLNRLQIVSAPVLRTQYFWHNAVVRKDRDNIPLIITVGLQYDGKIEPVTMRFRNRGEDLIYCAPDTTTRDKPEVLDAAAKLDVNLLYPMSGLQTEEPVLQPNRIDGLLGQGQTAQVLRNLCLLVYKNSPTAWEKIVDHMWHMFSIELRAPKENPRGFIDLFYNQIGVKVPFDISLSGRGFQQTLLILSYLYSHNRSVLLIDEPDAHLEILRQRQIYILLRDVAEKNESQVVLVTHSPSLMDEGLHNGNLTLLLGSNSENIADKTGVPEALKYYGTQHYPRARQCGHVLYLEGRSDFHILQALAEKLGHQVTKYFDILHEPVKKPDRSIAEKRIPLINLYLSHDAYPETGMDAELKRVEGGFGFSPEQHFSSLQKLVPELCGLAIRDGDAKNRDDIKSQLSITYWKRYEIENYFVTRELLLNSIKNHYKERPLLKDLAPNILDKLIQERIFDNKSDDFDIWKKTLPEAQRLVWEGKTANHKLSALAEEFYEKLADATGGPVLYRKGKFYELIKLVEPESIPEEVTEKLNRLQKLLENSSPQE